MMNSEIGFGRKVLEVFEENNISFEHLPSGVDTMGVVVETKQIDGVVGDKILNRLERTVHPDNCVIEHGLALIAVVGRGIVKTKGTAARIFDAISDADVNIKMIDQGSSELNIIIGVEESDFEKALTAIYDEFVNKK
jgi:aspartate kinase